MDPNDTISERLYKFLISELEVGPRLEFVCCCCRKETCGTRIPYSPGEFVSETSKKDAENMVFLKLASTLFRSKFIEHYGHYREEAEQKRQTKNPEVVQATVVAPNVVQAPVMAPNVIQAPVMAPNVIQAPVMAPNEAANAATVGVVENTSVQDGVRRSPFPDLIPAPIVPTVPSLVPAPVKAPCSAPILVRPQGEWPAAAAVAPTKPTIGLVCDSDDEWEPAGEAAPRIHPPEQEEEYDDSTVPDRIIQLQLNRQRTNENSVS
ncbi:hypothetical protein DAPPUDRAFT_117741 [Daphnia pulex]|uniref:Uncharacterized protein n=1 Tax=Daphnia pulex TaxID=6669 RepID=E9HTN0_DAPPU|nr:hypothetical protein DAPPUDRAFT_117741 [Daphnia pulex]|eukprot:EFX64904.1 hypothetical protein DAPPUDRAFT_117741 [Daphnia pulex]